MNSILTSTDDLNYRLVSQEKMFYVRCKRKQMDKLLIKVNVT